MTYKIDYIDGILKIGFGEPAQNDQIVKDVEELLSEMIKSGEIAGGEIVKINGPASLPVAMVICHKLSHLFGAIACFDPKMGKYVVAVSHNPKYSLGDLID